MRSRSSPIESGHVGWGVRALHPLLRSSWAPPSATSGSPRLVHVQLGSVIGSRYTVRHQ